MKLYLRYTTFVYLKIFLMIAAGLTLTAALIQIVAFLSTAMSHIDLDLVIIVKILFLCLPAIFVYVAPIALICTILYYFHLLSSDNELLILELTGIPRRSLAIPAFGVMVGTTILSLALCFYINPICKRHMLLQREAMHKNMVNAVLKEKTFTKISNKLMLYVEKREEGNNLKGVMIYDKTNPDEATTILANSASLINENDKVALKLHNGSRQKLVNGNLQILYFKSLIFDVSEYSKKFINLNNDIDSQSITRLIALRKQNESNAGFQRQIDQDIHRRISWPLLNLAIPILFLFSALSPKEDRTQSMKRKNIVASVSFTLLAMLLYFYSINRAGIKPGFAVAVYMNLLAFFVLGLLLLRSVDGKSIRLLRSLSFNSNGPGKGKK